MPFGARGIQRSVGAELKEVDKNSTGVELIGPLLVRTIFVEAKIHGLPTLRHLAPLGLKRLLHEPEMRSGSLRLPQRLVDSIACGERRNFHLLVHEAMEIKLIEFANHFCE